MTGALRRCIPQNKNKTSLSSVCLAATHSVTAFCQVCQREDQPTDVGYWVCAMRYFCEIHLLKLKFTLTWFEPCISFWRTIAVHLADVLPQHRVAAKHSNSYQCGHRGDVVLTALSVHQGSALHCKCYHVSSVSGVFFPQANVW